MPADSRRPWPGAAAIVLAVLFNVSYAILAATYDYPDVLRGRPGGRSISLPPAADPHLLTKLRLMDLANTSTSVIIATYHPIAAR